jgi:toxin-antitoxin system PIN domain toxin
MMTVYLLDVNLLLALSDPMHIHHEAAHRWFAAVGVHAWATCPLTENAYVRIASHPGYPNRLGEAAVVLGSLRRLNAIPEHQFWPDDASLADLVLPGAALSHGQVTDAYLLGLAVRRKGKLATLDRRISTEVVKGGAEALELIEPNERQRPEESR